LRIAAIRDGSGHPFQSIQPVEFANIVR